jgi:CBS domain-containing protein
VFRLLPIHWMWWPALGGLVVGIGGLIFPQALGVGYETIGALLQGEVSGRVILGILLVKWIIWSVSLGSGTSGGVLAPLLLMGGALGGLEAMALPDLGAGFWPLVSMGAILGGTMRSPFTGVVFVLELTHDVNMLLPLLVAVTLAHGFTVLLLRRSILTEKVARRGFHLSREYAVDPLEILFTREVMHQNVVALSTDAPFESLSQALAIDPKKGPQRLFPVVDESRRLVGVVTRVDLQRVVDGGTSKASSALTEVIRATPTVAHPDEPLRVIVHRMAHTGLTHFPVIERGNGQHLVGLIALDDLLRARQLNLEAERRRERVFRFETLLPFGRRTA